MNKDDDTEHRGQRSLLSQSDDHDEETQQPQNKSTRSPNHDAHPGKKNEQNELDLSEPDVVVNLTQEKSPLPVKKLLPAFIMVFTESFNSASIFSYVGYMVLDFLGPGTDRATAGYYAGFIASTFFLMQFVSSFFWGKMADRFGRRPILLSGAFGSLLSSTGFGFSWSLWSAVLFRSANGLLNENIGVTKTYIGEITDSTNQADAFGLFNLSWALAQIIGAGLGGLLARPAITMPSIFVPDGLFGKFPYLLPNLIASILTAIGLILAVFYLTENDVFLRIKGRRERAAKIQKEIELEPLDEEVIEEEDLENGKTNARIVKSNSRNDLLRSSQKLRKSIQEKPYNIDEQEGSVFKNKNALLCCFLYAVLGMTFTVFDECYPLWALLEPSEGGIGFTTAQIAYYSVCGGIWSSICQILIWPRIAKGLRPTITFRLGCITILPTTLGLTFLNLLTRQNSGLPTIFIYIYLAIFAIFYRTGSTLAFSAVMLLINNSVHYGQMGTVNGIGQSMVACLRTFGPIVATNVFAWSSSNGLPFPFDYHLIFFYTATQAVCLMLLSLPLSETLNRPRAEILALKKQQEKEMANCMHTGE